MKPTVICDVECYIDYFLVKFLDADDGQTMWEYEQYAGQPLDRQSIGWFLQNARIVTFNGIKYDVPIITLAMTGASCETLKTATNQIIGGGLTPWQFYDHWRLPAPDLDHIDLFEVAPGQGSLKMYGGKMHSRRLQDLPFDPSASIAPEQRPVLREYCGNDLLTTRDLWRTFQAQIALRESMSAEYGVDLRSKSDAQIAEAVMKSLLPFKVDTDAVRAAWPAGKQFYYRPPDWLHFQELDVLNLLARSPFTIAESGSVEMTKELENTRIAIGGSVYRMGIGGLHSSESGVCWRSDDTHVITDHDVASYYPSLILRTGIDPQQLGGHFVSKYRGWYERRLAAKAAGDKKRANSLKTLLNGTFGKLLSKWSIFYAPTEGIQVTVTGQLALLMLIEMLEICGVPVISANTDGIVVRCPRHLETVRDDCLRWWETVTGFETERTDYRLIASRDVNNYVAVKPDGTVKLKGAYAPPEPGASGWPNPTGQIATDAVVAYLTAGTPLEDTIRACRDVRQFVHIRQVKGGGSWEGEYLGKAVRWYYAYGENEPIRYVSSGNKVARTDGCRPLMTLPDELPDDVNYDWYIAEARGLLADLGVTVG